MNDAALLAAASALAGEPLRDLAAVRGGGNNRLYSVTGARRRFALKRYPDDPHDARERYRREFGALAFLRRTGETQVPEPIALDERNGLALYGWVDGERVAERSDDDIAALAAFAARLHASRERTDAAALADAREAVFERSELNGQIRRRVARLRAEATHAARLDSLLATIESLIDAAGDVPPAVLAFDRRTLSPSDFGFHNAVRTPSGLVFLDFEYFGWDDPVKLVADILWHPGMELQASERQKFYALAADVYGVDHCFAGRFERDAPSYGLRWALIALNEFLPAMWQQRAAAGEGTSHVAALERQFAKASVLVERVRSGDALA